MKTWKQIVEMIQLQDEVKRKLLELEKESFAPDENGFKTLLGMLQEASYAYEKYKQLGISDEIFVDTMKCFTRFVEEHKVSYGYYGFDRGFWTGRQLSLLLFRIGELEFEKCIKDGKCMVDMHIPSDALLTRENCLDSIQKSKAFFEKYDKRFVDVPYTCESWLLSPVLKELLPENARIIQFQNMFQIDHVDKEDQSFMEWVFKRNDIPVEDLPESTSLQRKIKSHLQQGGWIGEAKGILNIGKSNIYC